MRFLRYLYVSEINGYVDHEKLESLETQIQFMADNVGRLCFCFWVHRYEDEDDDNNLSKPQYLLGLIVLVELEMKKIFLEFLLVFLGDVPNRVINGKRLNEVLEKIGILVGDILYVIKMLLADLSNQRRRLAKLSWHNTNIEKIEDLKAQVEEVYKLQYSPSNEFPIVGGLSFLDSLQRKLNEMLKSESSFDCMMKPSIDILEEELSSLTLDFRDVAKVQHIHDEILNDLQRRTVNLAYEAEVSIDSILVQYNSLWHFYCSLPAITKEIKHIRAKRKASQNTESGRSLKRQQKVHDIVLHFLLEKSREERFMLAVKDQFQPYDWNRSRVSFSFSEEDSMFASPSPKTRNPFHQHLRSLIMTSPVGSYRWNPFLQCVKLRFLKIALMCYYRVLQRFISNWRSYQAASPFLWLSPSSIQITLAFKFKEVGTNRGSSRKHFLHCRTTKPGVSQLSVPFTRTYTSAWCLGDITFHKLKVLKLVRLGISTWDTSEDPFPA
ncbi:hypothetical protein HAX54_015056 [Datura stramonium]|uniref:Uncharacterized protein n=1 Tax=Datura stramonium TaxID=4076 RepID=A0ABS8TNY4_DATST|nr:hypothetical protein [Datura stramonium]